MMLEFAMRNGDVLRLRDENFVKGTPRVKYVLRQGGNVKNVKNLFLKRS